MRRPLRIPFSLLLVFALMPILGGARCESDVNVGGDQDGGVMVDGGGTYDPCSASTCGASCTLCDPADAECVETAVEKMCQPDGSCAATVPECGASYDPCNGLSCGASCSVCDPADSECVAPAVETMCQPDGSCGGITPECDAPYDPCGGLSCGTSCSLCDPADTDCVETDELKWCQTDGTCSSSGGLAPECGAEYDPCGGLSCGASCTLCDPADPLCVETAVEKMCQPGGSCSATVPDCSGTCEAAARDLVSGDEVDLEAGRLCDDLFVCIDSRSDGAHIEGASSSFDCPAGMSAPGCSGFACRMVPGPSTLDAAELADICAVNAALQTGEEFVCAVYL